MTGLNHGWDKDETNHADFIHGGVDVDDFTKEVNYAPRKKKKKGCKRSKDGAPCAFTKKVVRHQWYSPSRERWVVNTVMVCERCGKHDWTTYGYIYRTTEH